MPSQSPRNTGRDSHIHSYATMIRDVVEMTQRYREGQPTSVRVSWRPLSRTLKMGRVGHLSGRHWKSRPSRDRMLVASYCSRVEKQHFHSRVRRTNWLTPPYSGHCSLGLERPSLPGLLGKNLFSHSGLAQLSSSL